VTGRSRSRSVHRMTRSGIARRVALALSVAAAVAVTVAAPALGQADGSFPVNDRAR